MVSETFSKENSDSSHALPQGWVITQLGQIIDFEYGKRLPESIRDSFGSIPVYGSNGIVGLHSVALVNTPSIIVGRKGGAGEVHLSKTPCFPIDTTYFVRPTKNLDLTFLFNLLKSLQLSRLDRSTAIPGLNRNDAYKSRISLPPLSEQHRIVTKIEELFTQLDAGVASLKKVQAQLKRYRQAVLKAAFEGRLTQEWREVHKGEIEPADELIERINKARNNTASSKNDETNTTITDVQSLPDTWSWIRLDNIAFIKGGITKDGKRIVENGRLVPYLRVANVQNGYLDLTEMKCIEADEIEIINLSLKMGDILFTEGGDRDKLGRGWIWQDEIPECIYQNHIFRARFYLDEISSKYVSWFGNTHSQKYFMKKGKQTTNLASISLTQLRAFPVALPPIEEQVVIVNEIERHFSQIDHLELTITTSLRQAETLRQSILKQAFEGKLVPQDPNDEPASILLERIKAEKARRAAEVKKDKSLQLKSPKRKIKDVD